jgi:hypothetical protein
MQCAQRVRLLFFLCVFHVNVLFHCVCKRTVHLALLENINENVFNSRIKHTYSAFFTLIILKTKQVYSKINSIIFSLLLDFSINYLVAYSIKFI